MKTRAFVPHDSIFPFLGVDYLSPSSLKDPRFSPEVSNIALSKGALGKRGGYTSLGTGLSGTVKALAEFERADGTKILVCITSTGVFKYESAGETWDDLTGLETIADINTAWPLEDIRLLDDMPIGNGVDPPPVDTASMLHTIGDTGTGPIYQLASTFSPAKDWTGYSYIEFWFRSSIALDAGDLSVGISETTDMADATLFDLPAITAETWTYVRIAADMSALNAVLNWGLVLNVDKGGFYFNLHNIYLGTFEGSDTEDVDWIVSTDSAGTFLIFTNNTDPPKMWDGSTATIEDLPVDITNFETCKCLGQINGYLFLGNVTINGANDPKGVVWSNVGDFTDWTTGTSGSALVPSIRGEILRILPLADRLVIYGDRSISQIIYVGGSVTFAFETVVTDSSLVSPRAVVNLGPVHLLMGKGNVFFYDGGRQLTKVGDRIFRKYRQDFSLENLSKAFAHVDFQAEMVYLILPTSATSCEIFVGEFDHNALADVRWTIYTFADVPSAMGEYSAQDTLAWDSTSLVGFNWPGATWAWNETSSGGDYPLTVFGSGSDVFLLSSAASSDNGEDIESFWDSVDFTVPGAHRSFKSRWQEIELELRGTSVDVQYSTDGGLTFTDIETLTLTPTFDTYRVFFDTTSDRMRIRLRSDGTDAFELQWLRVWYRPGAAR